MQTSQPMKRSATGITGWRRAPVSDLRTLTETSRTIRRSAFDLGRRTKSDSAKLLKIVRPARFEHATFWFVAVMLGVHRFQWDLLSTTYRRLLLQIVHHFH